MIKNIKHKYVSRELFDVHWQLPLCAVVLGTRRYTYSMIEYEIVDNLYE